MSSAGEPAHPIEVRDNPADQRYEALVDGNLAAFLEYSDRDGRRVLVHTEVLHAYTGRGVGNRVVAAALDDARSRGLRPVPVCRFVRAFIARHPEYDPGP